MQDVAIHPFFLLTLYDGIFVKILDIFCLFRSYSLAVKGGKLTFYTERGRTLSLPNMINDGLIHDIKFRKILV